MFILKVVSQIADQQEERQSCSILDGPYCFLQLSKAKANTDNDAVEQEPLFLSHENYKEQRQVPLEKTIATKFIDLADDMEVQKPKSQKTMTAFYQLKFDDIWMDKLPWASQRDYS